MCHCRAPLLSEPPSQSVFLMGALLLAGEAPLTDMPNSLMPIDQPNGRWVVMPGEPSSPQLCLPAWAHGVCTGCPHRIWSSCVPWTCRGRGGRTGAPPGPHGWQPLRAQSPHPRFPDQPGSWPFGWNGPGLPPSPRTPPRESFSLRGWTRKIRKLLQVDPAPRASPERGRAACLALGRLGEAWCARPRATFGQSRTFGSRCPDGKEKHRQQGSWICRWLCPQLQPLSTFLVSPRPGLLIYELSIVCSRSYCKSKQKDVLKNSEDCVERILLFSHVFSMVGTPVIRAVNG